MDNGSEEGNQGIDSRLEGREAASYVMVAFEKGCRFTAWLMADVREVYWPKWALDLLRISGDYSVSSLDHRSPPNYCTGKGL